MNEGEVAYGPEDQPDDTLPSETERGRGRGATVGLTRSGATGGRCPSCGQPGTGGATCTACRVLKPAALGAAAGVLLAMFTRQDIGRGVLWGGVSGGAIGWWQGR